MTEKTYTAAEVAALLEAERAKSNKAITVSLKSGTRKDGKPFSGVEVKGDFFPVYLSRTAAKAVAENASQILALLAQPIPTVAEKPSMAPRLAPKA